MSYDLPILMNSLFPHDKRVIYKVYELNNMDFTLMSS